MIENGDYIDIRFQETPRYKKPAGAYWIQTAAVQVLSPNELNSIWAYRIPSFLAALSAVLLTYAIASLFMNKNSALLSGVFLSLSFLLNVEAHMAKTDALLLTSILISQYGLAKAYKRDVTNLSWLCFWIGLGFGILFKGPIAPLIIVLTIFALWFFDRNLIWFKDLRPITGTVIVAMITLPWIITVQMHSDGAFLKSSIGGDLLPKLIGGMESHGMPPGYYLLIIMITFWPSSLFIWPSLVNLIKTKNKESSKFLMAWIIPAWLLLELIPTKLPHYVLPLFPAIAIMGAKWVSEFKFHNMTLGTKLFSGLWLIIGVVLITASFLLVNSNNDMIMSLPDAISLDLLAQHTLIVFYNSPIIIGISLISILILVLTVILVWKIQLKAAIVCSVFLAILFFIPLTYSTIPNIKWAFPSANIANFLKSTNNVNNSIISIGYHEPSLIFLTGTNTYLTGVENGAKRFAENPKNIALVTRSNLKDFSDATKRLGINLKTAKTFHGFNYSKGRQLTIDLLTFTTSTK